MATYDFPGEARTPAPLSPPISEFQQFESTFIYSFAGPGQFINRLLIISVDVKGKDSMILFF